MTNVEMKKETFNQLGANLVTRVKDLLEMLEDVKRSHTQYTLLDDIRTGKIIPIVAATGRPANVTFS